MTEIKGGDFMFCLSTQKNGHPFMKTVDGLGVPLLPKSIYMTAKLLKSIFYIQNCLLDGVGFWRNHVADAFGLDNFAEKRGARCHHRNIVGQVMKSFGCKPIITVALAARIQIDRITAKTTGNDSSYPIRIGYVADRKSTRLNSSHLGISY